MLLTDKITAIYCLVDDLLKACGHHTPEGAGAAMQKLVPLLWSVLYCSKAMQSLA